MHPHDYEKEKRTKIFALLDACDGSGDPTEKIFDILNDWDCDIVAEWMDSQPEYKLEADDLPF